MKIAARAVLLGVVGLLAVGGARASQLSSDAKAAIPKDVQQLIVVDYRAMQGSSAAMNLKARIMPPELTRLETALRNSGMKVDRDADTLAFAAFRTGQQVHTVGIAQGQFNTASILGTFAKNKTKPLVLRNYNIYPMGAAGMSVVFLNQTTMIFGDASAVRAGLDSRDGITENMLQNGDMMNEMNVVDSRAIWSLLDQKGTQTMMRSVLGEAAALTDYDSVKNRMRSSRYTLDFANGIHFNMAVVMSDTMTAATAAALMKGVVLMKQVQGSTMEKTAMTETQVDSSAGTLQVSYASSEGQFSDLLNSPLFQQVVK
ncbi:hypothetical protein Terro_2471 [Terriglobus roseus DSM 18391]|uniref:Uncharacterized protein n=1 Tax=Terriglobus roseus (strain DSM 18391 / NRRL B-41598 / KBS 63) TaxID=926566 RepID=I3ZGL1_TERRK|nr:hypothetical protein [Terriglobus roseus]AFL88379.1 hypothetical protein Terro_2107 [Terriglobus roseus DSM 18391]AFL88720.1 hypothetical protein Terro_2471 [Terriglobus roseus DSM 18391]